MNNRQTMAVIVGATLGTLTTLFYRHIKDIKQRPNTIEFTSMFNGIQIVQARDYQIDIVEDSLLIWDGNRYVGTIPAFDSSSLSKLMMYDNQ